MTDDEPDVATMIEYLLANISGASGYFGYVLDMQRALEAGKTLTPDQARGIRRGYERARAPKGHPVLGPKMCGDLR